MCPFIFVHVSIQEPHAGFTLIEAGALCHYSSPRNPTNLFLSPRQQQQYTPEEML
jgi:hypothetical protein